MKLGKEGAGAGEDCAHEGHRQQHVMNVISHDMAVNNGNNLTDLTGR